MRSLAERCRKRTLGRSIVRATFYIGRTAGQKYERGQTASMRPPKYFLNVIFEMSDLNYLCDQISRYIY